VQKAIQKFLDGSWANRAKKFVLCTNQSVTPTKLAEECEAETHVLKSKGVKFVVWDQERSSELLRGHPRLVFDFFGRAWVEAFLGQEALLQLAGRLETSQVSEFRCKLSTFYVAIFKEQDPGISVPPRPGVDSVSILDRFVSQDVYVEEGSASTAFLDSKQRPNQAEGEDYGGVARSSRSQEESQNKKEAGTSSSFATSYRSRGPLAIWLGRSKNSLIGARKRQEHFAALSCTGNPNGELAEQAIRTAVGRVSAGVAAVRVLDKGHRRKRSH